MLGKLTAASGEGSSAAAHYSEALRCYGAALAQPTALGDLRERCDVRCLTWHRNCACSGVASAPLQPVRQMGLGAALYSQTPQSVPPWAP
jgi:hypothetical protein